MLEIAIQGNAEFPDSLVQESRGKVSLVMATAEHCDFACGFYHLRNVDKRLKNLDLQILSCQKLKQSTKI